MRIMIAVVLACWCSVVVAEGMTNEQMENLNKISGICTDHGTFPVKYHEMYGPYKLWTVSGPAGVVSFEARFVGIKGGRVMFGIDDASTGITKTKQMKGFSLSMNRFALPVQNEIKKEHQLRLKAEKEKRTLYPEPPPKPPEEKKEAAKDPKRRTESYVPGVKKKKP